MTPEQLRTLARAPTEQVRFVGHPHFMEINAVLADLSPDLARLCAEMAEALQAVERVWEESLIGDLPRNPVSAVLAKLAELEAR